MFYRRFTECCKNIAAKSKTFMKLTYAANHSLQLLSVVFAANRDCPFGLPICQISRDRLPLYRSTMCSIGEK